jgi:anaerobic carbon-monoxide dehydrogenase iron sulfur subunit
MGVAGMKRIKVLIADDRKRSRAGMRALLATWSDIEIVGTAADGLEAVQSVGRLRPDVVLMDVRMPRANGLEATRQIKCSWPQTWLVILSLYGSYRQAALGAGADRFLLKGGRAEELLDAIRAVASSGHVSEFGARADRLQRINDKEEIKEGKMTNVLMVHPDKCTGCRSCELACTFSHEGSFRPVASRVHAYTWEREGMSVPMMCQQCDPAACVAVCPTGAMHPNKAAGVVEWDVSKCIRCRMCTLACPFGNAAFDAKTNSILKCDTCNGNPECVQVCPTQALEYLGDTVAIRSRKKAYAAKFKDAFQEVR